MTAMAYDIDMQAPPARALAGAHRPRLRQQGPLPRHLQYAFFHQPCMHAHLLQFHFPSFLHHLLLISACCIHYYIYIHAHSSFSYTTRNASFHIYIYSIHVRSATHSISISSFSYSRPSHCMHGMEPCMETATTGGFTMMMMSSTPSIARHFV